MRRNVWAFIIIGILLVATALLIALLPRAPHDTMADTLVKLVPSKEEVNPGEQFTVEVVIEPAAGTNIAGAQFDLAFNPQSVQIDNIQEGDFLTQGGAESFFNLGTVDNEAGKLTAVFGTVIGPGQDLPGPGTFAIITCTAVSAPTTSAFALSNVIVGNKDGVAVPLGSITVGQVAVTFLGDVNNDGVVDVTDLEDMATVFGETGAPGFSGADVDKDGTINVLDAILVSQHIGIA